MPKRTPNAPASGANPGGGVGGAAATCPMGRPWPTSPPNPHDEYSFDDYVKTWEAEHCRKMTPQELSTLKAGCIVITALNLGVNHNPPLNNCYDTLDHAKARANDMKATCAAQGLKPKIFSKRFYSSGNPYTPDPNTGKIDMSGYHYETKPPEADNPDGYTNFDYGWYDEKSNSWWHANHGDYRDPSNPMKVYRSTLSYYSRPLLDFDRQVFGVACGP